jgi:hypothetical protein
MKLVWKCDFCSETGTKEKIKEHEKICNFNPKLKLCHSCKYHAYSGSEIFGYNDDCEISKNCFKILDEKIPCEFWDTDDISLKRRMKLKNIL